MLHGVKCSLSRHGCRRGGWITMDGDGSAG
jgi:hypothetical protein